MKKILGIIGFLVLVFIILIYWSLHTGPKKIENSILINFDNVEKLNFKDYDSVVVAATTQYRGTDLKRLMQGEHYRKAWSTPIKVPVVFLDTLFGGVKIIDEGGGKQTQSLKLLAQNGIQYTLRSINKKPDALVPEIAKSLGLENIIIDGISAQHPYGAVVVAQLAQKVGIIHTNPRIIFVPKQSVLGSYNDTYGNRLYLLEYETDSEVNWTQYQNSIGILDTEDLQELKQIHGSQLQIDRKALVRVRLFDLLIGDWDRHAKQWGWVVQLQGEYLNAIPLAGDRDNAFFNLGGIIPSLIANKNIKPEMRPYHKEIDYLPGLVQPFDVYFLKNTPESVFVDEANNLKKLLTDEVIDEALQVWPENIYDLDAITISEKIKNRRDDLLDYAKGFKMILDEKPGLTEPLKGSEDLKLSKQLLSCFDCAD